MTDTVRNKILTLLDDLDTSQGCSSCDQNTEILIEILDCVKSIHALLKSQFETETEFEPPPPKRRRSSNSESNSKNKVYIEVPDYETEHFEDVTFLEEEMPIEVNKDNVNVNLSSDEGNVTHSILEFPLKTVDEVNVLEQCLADPKSPYRRKIVDLMLGTGFEQKDYKYAIRTFFRVVYESAVMANYCWLGNDTKHSLKDLTNTLQFFESTVRKWAPTWKKDDFAVVVKNYVRNCPAKVAHDALKKSEATSITSENEG